MSSRSATVGGKNIELRPREYALLEYLMRNKGRIVTETNIIEHVWDIQSEPFTNVVSVYIYHLRTKIEKGVGQKLIHTVRTLGYVMRDDE